MRVIRYLLVSSLAAAACAQRGDRPNDPQTMLPDSVVVPPAIVRSPEDAKKTLIVQDGCRVELFASEPLVRDPVVATFDAAGRCWVAEFTSYMNDIDATDEDAKTGRIVVLHDDDQDGVADRSTVFADKLVLPRAVLPMRGGALVITPPNLVWMPDEDGDLRADGQVHVMGGFEAGTANPEHSGNGLTWGFDHRIHLCNDKRLLRRKGDGFAIEAGAGGGQWGTCIDDRGRFYFNYNSDWLRCDLVPNHYGAIASRIGGLPALNHRVVKDRSVWPAHITPGVNRGYRKGVLRDYTLAVHTGVCSPLIYRGDLLPYDGDGFICEPCGNCVRRVVFTEHDRRMQASNPYQGQQKEFLASTDERFRPVNLLNGPDGAIYVVDMYRGVIQHRNYVTSFLRDQVIKRKLEQPVGLGRIWRVVPNKDVARKPMPKLVDATAQQLLTGLQHASGCVRDLALREVVEQRPAGIAPMIRQQLLAHERPAVRIVGLSALAGMSLLQQGDVRRCIRDQDVGVQAFAWQHAGAFLSRGDPMLWGAIERWGVDTPAAVRWHGALAIGDALRAQGLRRERTNERAFARLAQFVLEAPGDSYLRAAVATAAHPQIDRIVGLLGENLPEKPDKALRDAVRDLARRATRSRDAACQQRLLDRAAAANSARHARAILQGMVACLPKGARRAGWLTFGNVPQTLLGLSKHADEVVRGHAQTLLSAVRIDGQAAEGVVENLSDAERTRVKHGARIYRGACAACHQLDGRGQGGLAPPLRDSDWVLGPPARLMRIALHGVRGPIEVDGKTWDLEMPAQAHLSDEELAQVLSYVRRAFGHKASCIEPKQVGAVRKATKSHAGPYSAAELLGTK